MYWIRGSSNDLICVSSHLEFQWRRHVRRVGVKHSGPARPDVESQGIPLVERRLRPGVNEAVRGGDERVRGVHSRPAESEVRLLIDTFH